MEACLAFLSFFFLFGFETKPDQKCLSSSFDHMTSVLVKIVLPWYTELISYPALHTIHSHVLTPYWLAKQEEGHFMLHFPVGGSDR